MKGVLDYKLYQLGVVGIYQNHKQIITRVESKPLKRVAINNSKKIDVAADEYMYTIIRTLEFKVYILGFTLL